MNNKINTVLSTSAAGGVVTPNDVYGQFLNSNGLWMISYAEWMKIIGTIYIVFMIVSLIIKAVNSLIKTIKKRSKKKEVTRKEYKIYTPDLKNLYAGPKRRKNRMSK